MSPLCAALRRQKFFAALFSLVRTDREQVETRESITIREMEINTRPVFRPVGTWTNNYLFDGDIRCTVIVARASDVNEIIVRLLFFLVFFYFLFF